MLSGTVPLWTTAKLVPATTGKGFNFPAFVSLYEVYRLTFPLPLSLCLSAGLSFSLSVYLPPFPLSPLLSYPRLYVFLYKCVQVQIDS